MKYYISYFYNIRHFPKEILPLSTAHFDPKWFHPASNPKGYFKDKRGIWNGFRVPALSPGPSCDGQCSGPNGCKQEPGSCDFLKNYRKQLSEIDFPKFIQNVQDLIHRFEGYEHVKDASPCFLVYEKPDNPCSERQAIVELFEKNGYSLEEWHL